MEYNRDIYVGLNARADNMIGRTIILDRSALDLIEPCKYGDGRCTCCNVSGPWWSKSHLENFANHLPGVLTYVREDVKKSLTTNYLRTMHRKPMYSDLHGKQSYWTQYNGSRCHFVMDNANNPTGVEGCSIFKYCHDNNLDAYKIKPIDCDLFPVRWELKPDTLTLIKAQYVNRPDEKIKCPCLATVTTETSTRMNALVIEYMKDEVMHAFDINEEDFNYLVNKYKLMYNIQ